jgi:hypothetical protein
MEEKRKKAEKAIQEINKLIKENNLEMIIVHSIQFNLKNDEISTKNTEIMEVK